MVNHFPYRLSHLPKPTQQVSCRAGMDRTLSVSPGTEADLLSIAVPCLPGSPAFLGDARFFAQ